jgi:branched-chain amino acid aminotransferase
MQPQDTSPPSSKTKSPGDDADGLNPAAALPSGLAVWIDGVRVNASEAKVSVLDRGFLYGDSVFETIRTYGGKAFALDEHLQRLERSARLVHIELPVELDQLRAEVNGALEEVPQEESYIRLMLTRGVGALGLDPGTAVEPLRVLIVAPLVPPPAQVYSEGVSVITYAVQRPGDATAAAGAKIGNYLVAVLATREARKRQAVEALIVDGLGHVVEGATSNVFVVSEGKLLTPSERDGILPGITRRTLLEVARNLGIEVQLGPLSPSQLHGADEVFISSSLREVLPVVRIDDVPVGAGVPGVLTLTLLAEFRKFVRPEG